MECIDRKIGDLIFQYEMGVLTEADCSRFERHLMECNHCLAEIEKLSPAIHALRESRSEIADAIRLQGIRTVPADELRHRKSRYKRLGSLQRGIAGVIDLILRPRVFWPATAAIAVIALLVYLPLTHQVENPYLSILYPDKLPYSAEQMRGSTVRGQDDFSSGMEYYLQGDYTSAIERLRKAVDISPDEGLWWLYLGICYYLDQQADPAIQSLERADSLTQYYDKINARWYLAQAYLLDNKPHQASPLLEWIVVQNKEYVGEAKALISLVDSIRVKQSQ